MHNIPIVQMWLSRFRELIVVALARAAMPRRTRVMSFIVKSLLGVVDSG